MLIKKIVNILFVIFIDNVIKIFEVAADLSDGLSEIDSALKGAKLLVKVLLTQYNERVEKFENLEY